MSSIIPFIDARFFSANEGRLELETRLKKHLRKLRCGKIPPEFLTPISDAEDADDSPGPDLMDFIGISAHDATRINRRAKRILECRKAASLQCHRPSLRVATRMLQRAADLEQGPTLH